MHVCTTVDLGPGFIAWAAEIEGTAVLLIASRVSEDEETKAQATELILRAGIDCSTCTMLCPLGLRSSTSGA